MGYFFQIFVAFVEYMNLRAMHNMHFWATLDLQFRKPESLWNKAINLM